MSNSGSTPDSFSIEVEHNDRGWVVVHVVDGVRKPIEPAYPDRESAERAASAHDAASDRWTGAATVTSPDARPTDIAEDRLDAT